MSDVKSGSAPRHLLKLVGLAVLFLTAEGKRINAEGAVPTDRYGDPLPTGAIARLGTVRFRHGFSVYVAAYSPDGKKIATVGTGRAVMLWDAATGKELHQFPSRSLPINIAFSPDGTMLATTDDSVCHLWDVSTGKERHRLAGQPKSARAIAFSPDGKTVAAGCFDGTILLWASATGELIRRLIDTDGETWIIAFSPDGRLLASAGTGRTIRLWNPNTGEELRRLVGHKDRIRGLSFSPDGKRLASASLDETLCLWDPMTGRRVRVLAEKPGASSLAFSRDGKRLASGHQDGTIRVWDPVTGEEKRRWRGYPYVVLSLAFSPDGKTLISGGASDSVVRFWDVSTGKEWQPFEGHHGGVDGLRFAPDGRTLISVGRDEQVIWWDLQTRTLRRRFAWQSWGRGAFALSADGNTLVAGGSHDKEVRVWGTRSDKPGRLLGKHEDKLWAVAVSPDGRLAASGGLESTIRIWDTASGKEVRTLKDFTDYPFCLAFSPDGRRLACGLRRRNVSANPTVRLWDVAGGKEVCRIESRNDLIGMGLVFSPDGQVLASGHETVSEGYVCLWDCSTGRELCRHSGHRDTVWRIAFSADGKRVASGSAGLTDNSIHLWEAATGRLIRRFEAPHSGVASLAFSPDGRTLATGGGDSTILLWDLLGQRKRVLTRHELDACWTALADSDAAKAYDAVWTLTATPEQAVPFLRKRLPPVPRPDANHVARLLMDLDNNDFTVRQKANEELTSFGDAIVTDLRRALEGRPALEVRRRVQQLLDQTRDWTAESLRDHRAIQALEHMRTPRAREALEGLAAGAPGARRTDEAKAALRRFGE
jgi:WD40 repeat protein